MYIQRKKSTTKDVSCSAYAHIQSCHEAHGLVGDSCACLSNRSSWVIRHSCSTEYAVCKNLLPIA